MSLEDLERDARDRLTRKHIRPDISELRIKNKVGVRTRRGARNGVDGRLRRDDHRKPKIKPPI